MLTIRLLPTDTEVFAILVDGVKVGMIAWRRTDEWTSRGHISYAVDEEHRCKGYAQTAVKELLVYISSEYPGEYEKVQVCCVVDNVVSRRVVENCGGERDLSRGEIFKDPSDNAWTVSYWVPVKKMLDTSDQKD